MQEIIHNAINALKQIAGINAIFQEDVLLDGILKIEANGRIYEFSIDVKQELRTHQIRQVEKNHQRYNNFLLLANRIFPKVKKELREKNIPYLEANGNIFLRKEEVYLFIDTQKPLSVEKRKANRAFTKTGLKVLFYLLQNKDAISLTQRELAKLTDVGLGTISQVIEGLREAGFLIPLKNRTYLWENRSKLLERWVEEYATTLKPTLIKERYTTKEKWSDIQFDKQDTVWGGEPAADIITNYLRPEKFLIYTKENRMNLIKKYKLKPDNDGEIEAFEMFWENNDDNTAPPLLIYTDLILEGGKRNRETAEIIYNEYIKPIL